MARNKRTDVHAPSRIQPEDYFFIAACYPEDNFMGTGMMDEAQRQHLQDHMKSTGGTYSGHAHGGCHVCGARFKYFAVFYHQQTNTYIKTGLDCAEKIDSENAALFRAIRNEAQALQHAKAGKLKAMATVKAAGLWDYISGMWASEKEFGGALKGYDVANPFDVQYGPHGEENWDNFDREKATRFRLAQHLGQEAADTLDMRTLQKFDSDFFTLADMVRNLVKYGSWSEKQVAFATKLVAKLSDIPAAVAKRKAELEAAVPAPTGRVVVSGTIVSTRVDDGLYGPSYKMLLQANEGFKVWCSVPRVLGNVEKGDKVEFTATLEVKGDDPSFAIGSRPAKAKRL